MRGHRDRFMAENADWLLRQAGPDARIVLWAHNGHVASGSGRMVGFRRALHGNDLVFFADRTTASRLLPLRHR